MVKLGLEICNHMCGFVRISAKFELLQIVIRGEIFGNLKEEMEFNLGNLLDFMMFYFLFFYLCTS